MNKPSNSGMQTGPKRLGSTQTRMILRTAMTTDRPTKKVWNLNWLGANGIGPLGQRQTLILDAFFPGIEMILPFGLEVVPHMIPNLSVG